MTSKPPRLAWAADLEDWEPRRRAVGAQAGWHRLAEHLLHLGGGALELGRRRGGSLRWCLSASRLAVHQRLRRRLGRRLAGRLVRRGRRLLALRRASSRRAACEISICEWGHAEAEAPMLPSRVGDAPLGAGGSLMPRDEHERRAALTTPTWPPSRAPCVRCDSRPETRTEQHKSHAIGGRAARERPRCS